MGENFDPKEILPLKLSSEHIYEFGTKSVQAFRSSLSAAEPPAETFQKGASNLFFSLFWWCSKSFRLSLSFGVQKIVAFIGSQNFNKLNIGY